MKKAFDTLLASLGMFTRIPMPYAPLLDNSRGLLLCYPIVGCVVGLLHLGLYRLLLYVEVGILPAAAQLTIFPWLLTGFMHLDGFMDIMDALLSGRDREKRLRILKDPNSGAFAVCAFGCLALVVFASVAELYEGHCDARLFFLLPIFSRGVAALSLVMADPIETSSMGRAFGAGIGASGKIWFALCAALALAGLVATSGTGWLLLAPLMALLAFRWAVGGLGGTSGDVAGFVLVVSEAALLLCYALFSRT